MLIAMQPINRPPNRDTGDSSTKNITDSRTNEETREYNRRNESEQPNGMGEQNEQYSSNSRTDSSERTNLQLNEQQTEKEVDNTSFFDDYKFIVGDSIFIGLQEFIVSNIDNEIITMYDNHSHWIKGQ